MTEPRRRLSSMSRPMGGYTTPHPELTPAPDWIGYRHSLANRWRRLDVGDVAVLCVDCGTETDVALVVHSPGCRP